MRMAFSKAALDGVVGGLAAVTGLVVGAPTSGSAGLQLGSVIKKTAMAETILMK